MSDARSTPPLWAPDHLADFTGSIARFWKKYVQFSGRASRREYWWSFLFVGVVYVLSLTLLYGGLGLWYATSDGEGVPPVIFPIGVALTVGWFLATVIPWLALEARRLHDANMSGFLLFIHLASGPGALVVFILCQLSPNPLGRRFDAPPGEAPRFGRVGDWPAAPGEPNTPYAVAYYGAPGTQAPAAPPAPRVEE
ncbi:hypothetical protein GCM10025783_18340 [Amnibacterium soli]|jgi:uncharacterized membrane protein YhaH (DUF805 family)|uniref:DUF805 domain-containing protein n=1 Tax=Amnibacterium soli TaxID=1282736 RepID=A0ABP8Z504_9MICO